MKEVQRTLLECGVVVLAGLLLALAANSLSNRGLNLTKNYFPSLPGQATRPLQQPFAGNPVLSESTGGQIAETTQARAVPSDSVHPLEEKGFQVISHEAVLEFFEDPRYEQEIYILIDARNDQHYGEAHIPAAYQFDHYHPEKDLDEVLEVCGTAEKIVVYCTGGDCEDSEYATIELINQGVDASLLFIYPGGITEWEEEALPMERGSRLSGNLVGRGDP